MSKRLEEMSNIEKYKLLACSDAQILGSVRGCPPGTGNKVCVANNCGSCIREYIKTNMETKYSLNKRSDLKKVFKELCKLKDIKISIKDTHEESQCIKLYFDNRVILDKIESLL